MRSSDVLRDIRKTLVEFKYVPHVAVEIYGRLFYLREAEVRALQVLAKRYYQESPAKFQEFKENVIVYSNKYKRSSKHTMNFRTDGIFSNEFDKGFYTANANMVFELL